MKRLRANYSGSGAIGTTSPKVKIEMKGKEWTCILCGKTQKKNSHFCWGGGSK
jgi:hypothetical protein